jgi:hypothetical protein
MGLFRNIVNFFTGNNVLNEDIKSFKRKGQSAVSDRTIKASAGEGYEFPAGFPSPTSISSFNIFYNSYINKTFKDEIDKMNQYRNMSEMPEISDVIDDAVNESTIQDLEGSTLKLKIVDEEISKNENTTKILLQEFEDLFYKKIGINNIIDDFLRTYFIDGRVYYERLINRNKQAEGIVGIKRLPSETIDFVYDPKTLKILKYYQYLKDGVKKPHLNATNNDPNIIVFEPEQIGAINYGVFGRNRFDIKGFLDKAKIPFNQLKLLETSVIIYRIVRAPERFVFKIDVGQMPRDKAMKFVEDVKNKMTKKQTYDPDTGTLTNTPDVLSVMDNFFLPTCLSLDTEIITTSGVKTLSKIIKEYNNGYINQVISKDIGTNKPYFADIKWAGVTRKNTKIVKVVFSTGQYHITTPDHRFILKDGTECEAQHLQANVELSAHLHPIYVNSVHPMLYTIDTGCIEVDDINHNFLTIAGVYVKNSSDGRGSDISTVGGNPAGFTELADVNYFMRKLYKALKYPMSRVSAIEGRQENTVLFASSPIGEIARDEIKWATFLEKQQNRFCNEFERLFLLHLEFKGLKKEFDLDESKIKITMTPPSFYKDKQQQLLRESKFSNYLALSNNPEFSKSWLMKRYLELDDEEIRENANGLKKDKKLGFSSVTDQPYEREYEEQNTEEE